MTTHVLGDTGILPGRSLRHILRSPDTIITGSEESYINYMLPGIPALFPLALTWIALGWLFGILVVAYVFAIVMYRRKIS